MSENQVETHKSFIASTRDRSKRRRLALDLPGIKDDEPLVEAEKQESDTILQDESLTPLQQRKQLAYGPAYIPSEETLRSNLLQEYVNSGRRPANFLLNTDFSQRFKEYPKLRRLLDLHTDLVDSYAHPAYYLPLDPISTTSLQPLLSTSIRYDAILIDPPHTLPWSELAALPIPQIASNPSFIWIWCGSGSGKDGIGLEKGRELLSKWGYRRCEDITWLKTNRQSVDQDLPTKSLLVSSKQHCLMGIRGTVRRSTDAHFVHCNVDTDVIVWAGDQDDPSLKPPELYTIIENFCLGTRRLQLFGSHKHLRRGWLTVGSDAALSIPDATDEMEPRPYMKWEYESYFDVTQGGVVCVPNTPEVDSLRPKSPPPRGGAAQNPSYSGGGIGRGRGNINTFQSPPQSMPSFQQQQQMMNPMFNPMAMNPMMGMPFMPMPMMAPINPLATLNASDWASFFTHQKNQQQPSRR